MTGLWQEISLENSLKNRVDQKLMTPQSAMMDIRTYDLLVSGFTYILTTALITAYHELSTVSGQLWRIVRVTAMHC